MAVGDGDTVTVGAGVGVASGRQAIKISNALPQSKRAQRDLLLTDGMCFSKHTFLPHQAIFPDKPLPYQLSVAG